MNKEKIHRIIHHPTAKLAAIGAFSFCGGVVVGIVIGRSRPTTPLSKEEQTELGEISRKVDELKVRRLVKESQVESFLEELVEEIDAEDEGERIIEIIEPEPEPELERRNVFAEAVSDDDGWDYEEEKKTRSSDEPYVLHKDEFWANEMGFNQRTYTYFNGDDILADEEDKPIYNYSQIVGELKFGHGSGDEKVVYIRNEKRKEEYEIVKDPGLFSVEIMGLEIEPNDRAKGLQHGVVRFPLKE